MKVHLAGGGDRIKVPVWNFDLHRACVDAALLQTTAKGDCARGTHRDKPAAQAAPATSPTTETTTASLDHRLEANRPREPP